MKYKPRESFIDKDTGYTYRVYKGNEYRELSMTYAVDVYNGETHIGEGFVNEETLNKLKKVEKIMCKECYGKGVKHQINGITGISTFKPCKCTKPKTKSVWHSNLIKNLAEYNRMNEEQVKEYIGVI